jgi:hypothetical protein
MSQRPSPAVPAPRMALRPMRASGLPLLVVSGCLGLSACGDDKTAAPGTAAPETARTTETAATPRQPPTLNAARVESALRKSLHGIELPAIPTTLYPKGGGAPQQSQLGGGRLKVRSVTCPPAVPLERGGTFTCDVNARHADATVRVKQLNASGSRLSFKASIKSEVAGGIPVETELKGRIKLK